MYELSPCAGELIAWFVIIFVITYTIIYAINVPSLREKGKPNPLFWSVFVTSTIITLFIIFLVWLVNLV